MSVFVRQEKIMVRTGLQSDPIDPTKTRLLFPLRPSHLDPHTWNSLIPLGGGFFMKYLAKTFLFAYENPHLNSARESGPSFMMDDVIKGAYLQLLPLFSL